MVRRLVLVAVVLGAASAHAGVKINLEMKHKGKVSQLNILVDGASIRMESADASGAPEDAFVRDAAKNRTLLISYKKKAYEEIGEEYLKQAAAAIAEVKAQIAALPPAQRAQAEAALKQQAEVMNGFRNLVPNEKYVRASGTKRIAGHSCDLYSVEMDGKRAADTCLIPWSDLRSEYGQLKESLKQLQGGTMFGAKGQMNAWGTGIGFPAWWRTVEEPGEEVTETTLVSIGTGAVPNSAFEPPAGFKKGSK